MEFMVSFLIRTLALVAELVLLRLRQLVAIRFRRRFLMGRQTFSLKSCSC